MITSLVFALNVEMCYGAGWELKGPLAGVIRRQNQSLKSSPSIQFSSVPLSPIQSIPGVFTVL
jgi:hypothetical protein